MVVAALENISALVQFLVGEFLFSVVTKYCFINHWVEDLLFPSVIPTTVCLQWTTFFVLADELARLPSFTGFKRVVFKEVWLAAEVLPVVSVNALRLVVLCVVGTPLGLKVEHEEVLVACHLVDQRCLDVLVGMGK